MDEFPPPQHATGPAAVDPPPAAAPAGAGLAAVLSPLLQRILELARWAPSGDNTQPWRFEPLGPDAVRVHARSSAEHGVYDLEGRANRLAIGALLETMHLAAGLAARRMRAAPAPDAAGATAWDVRFEMSDEVAADPLARGIERRSVQRRRMSTRPLSPTQKARLAAALPQGYAILWYEGARARWRMARLAYANARIRLTIPEAYAVHHRVIDWGCRYSTERIPEQALGVDRYSARFMRWALHSWDRIRFLNRWCLGHVLPRLQMDLLPGYFCGAHFALLAPATPACAADEIAAGRALQRFWLAITDLGWELQPQMTPVLFSQYVRRGRRFTTDAAAIGLAGRLNDELVDLVAPHDIERLFFLGRVGAGPAAAARSLRRPLHDLLATPRDGHNPPDDRSGLPGS